MVEAHDQRLPSAALKEDAVDVAVALRQLVSSEGTTASLESDGPRPWSRDEAAQVVTLHFDFIWRLLRRLGVREHDVDDAAQQVFLTATNRRGHGDVAAARSFLYGVALRVAANFRRTARRRREVSEDATTEPPAVAPEAEDVADLRRARVVLDRILERMPIELRAVFILSEIEQLPASGIAELVGIPPGTVASRLRRAREQFRKHLAELGSPDSMDGGRR